MTKKPKETKRPALRGKARLRSEIVEAARDLGAAGLMDRKDVEKITVRRRRWWGKVGPIDSLLLIYPGARPSRVAVRSGRSLSARLRLLGKRL